MQNNGTIEAIGGQGGTKGGIGGNGSVSYGKITREGNYVEENIAPTE